MLLTSAEQVLLTRDHRWRRWTIRICLSVLFMLLLLSVVGIALVSSSGITPDVAHTILTQRLTDKTTRAEVEHLIGKAQNESTQQNGSTMLEWHFTKHSINQVDLFEYKTFCNENGTIHNSSGIRCQFDGWSAWQIRWMLMKARFGWK